ncbi:ABC transporter substrate-binding protein, partial [Roseovarius pacificus]|uniref:ABC transporter substrate-binding protein n=1 Tax=Roseovarius pacificus TaxID=337701 RepID=UPI002A18C0AB
MKWSDGEDFNAEDVVFTLNMLKEQAPILVRSAAVDAAVASAEAVDDYTVHIKFNGPRPRFMFTYMMSKFDTGIYWVPEHVFNGIEDVASFKYYDLEKGWPLATGPYKIVSWSPTQKIVDRRDEWWGVETGFMDKMPEIERIIVVPFAGDTIMSQQIAGNSVDST